MLSEHVAIPPVEASTESEVKVSCSLGQLQLGSIVQLSRRSSYRNRDRFPHQSVFLRSHQKKNPEAFRRSFGFLSSVRSIVKRKKTGEMMEEEVAVKFRICLFFLFSSIGSRVFCLCQLLCKFTLFFRGPLKILEVVFRDPVSVRYELKFRNV